MICILSDEFIFLLSIHGLRFVCQGCWGDRRDKYGVVEISHRLESDTDHLVFHKERLFLSQTSCLSPPGAFLRVCQNDNMQEWSGTYYFHR